MKKRKEKKEKYFHRVFGASYLHRVSRASGFVTTILFYIQSLFSHICFFLFYFYSIILIFFISDFFSSAFHCYHLFWYLIFFLHASKHIRPRPQNRHIHHHFNFQFSFPPIDHPALTSTSAHTRLALTTSHTPSTPTSTSNTSSTPTSSSDFAHTLNPDFDFAHALEPQARLTNSHALLELQPRLSNSHASTPTSTSNFAHALEPQPLRTNSHTPWTPTPPFRLALVRMPA